MDTQKQQVAQRVKEANNILVTVSNNPSVDQLAACIGLTLALNKMGKHATAVFSGAVPSTIEFLQPEKTLEKNTDSLRDFIIALDKSKADKLRYKVEDRVVKIFITPYKTSISDKDLEFSQGDFNVDVVLALGVHAQADLDQAITSHGRILHDATVVTMNVRPGGELGSMNWLDPAASSLSELAVQLLDMLDKKLLDGQIATAMLTGIVAETERFSNAKTSPQTMSVSAELMAVGANQQLVATKLEEPAPPPPPPTSPIAQQDAHTDDGKDIPPEAKKPDDGTLEISHEEKAGNEPVTDAKQEEHAPEAPESHTDQPEQNQDGQQHTEAESRPEPAEPEHKTPMIHDVKSDHEGMMPSSKTHDKDEARPEEPREEPEEDREQDAKKNTGTPHEPNQDEGKDVHELPEPQTPGEGAEEPTPAAVSATEGELPMPEPPAEPVAPPQIHIDEHGALSPIVAAEPDEADEALLPPVKPMEPPSISHHNEAPKMVLEPPTLGGQLTANASSDSFGASGEDKDEEEAALPGLPAHDVPMLGNGQGLPGSAATTPSPAAPSDALGAPAPSPGLADSATPAAALPGIQPGEDGQPKTPAPGETLSDIERDVHSSHVSSAPEPAFIETPVPGGTPVTPASPFAPDPLAGASLPSAAPAAAGVGSSVPAFGSNPMDVLPPAGPMDQSGAPAAPSASVPASPAGNSAFSQPSVPIVGPDDLTPDEVADAFAAGGPASADTAQTPSVAPINTTPTLPDTTDTTGPINPSTDLGSARDAVAQAISGNTNPPPEAIQALNANPLNLPLGADAASPAGPAPAGATPPPEPVQPWMPPADAAAPQPAGVPNPATQFNPAAFGQDDDPNAPPPGPPPMMPQMPAA